MRVEDRTRWVGGGRTALERIVDGLLCDGGELGGGHVGDGDGGDSLEVGVVARGRPLGPCRDFAEDGPPWLDVQAGQAGHASALRHRGRQREALQGRAHHGCQDLSLRCFRFFLTFLLVLGVVELRDLTG